jgi:hypothetical protein
MCRIDGSINEIEEETDSGRNARFLVYWMTTTTTHTLTSYTSILTIASLSCTPSNFGLSLCGKRK